MCKASSITLVICCLFSLPTTLCAQNILSNLNYPNNILFGRDNLSQKTLPELESIYLKPIDIPGYGTKEDYEIFTAPFDKPSYLLIKNNDLVYKYWHGLKSSLAKPMQPVTKIPNNATVNRNVFYALYNKPRVDEKKKLRESWKRAFGFDVWYPYYKTKDIEEWVKERLSIKVSRLKGKPRFENNQILYVFNLGF